MLWIEVVYGTLMKMLKECYFRIAIQKHVVKIDCKSIVLNETANATTVWHYATVLKSKFEKKNHQEKSYSKPWRSVDIICTCKVVFLCQCCTKNEVFH